MALYRGNMAVTTKMGQRIRVRKDNVASTNGFNLVWPFGTVGRLEDTKNIEENDVKSLEKKSVPLFCVTLF